MATREAAISITLTAGADLSALQFRAIKVSTAADNTALQAGAGENAIGVLQDKPTSGNVGQIDILGVTKAEYGASVTRGAKLMSNASGQLITATSTNHVVAEALESGASGEVHNVLLDRHGILV